jgi:filamentous hemagglutinin family protein
MTKTQQAETKSFTVRTGGRKLTYVIRPRKRFSNLLKFLIAIFGGQVILWPGMAAAQGLAANALPTGGSVVTGGATLNQAGNAMTVNQTSSKVIINYATFNIGTDASVTFKQPSSSSVALNQVVGTDPSQILGRLSSNGQVWLQNAAGVYFGKTATVDVGGMLATTLRVNNEQFMNGNTITMENSGNAGSVVNEGRITAKEGGYVALIAPSVTNAGLINAPMGTVRMAAGDKVTVDMAGDGLIKLNIDKASAQAVVTNAGVISANGGTVVMSARSAGDLASLVVNNTGIIEAKSLGMRNGKIFLDGGSNGIVQNSGSLIATGEAAGTKGGQVQMAGDKVGVVGNGVVDVSGDAGGGQAIIGGAYKGENTTSIIDGSAVKNAQVVAVTQNAVIKADAISTGDGGKVTLWSDDTTRFAGSVSAQGGAKSGNGGFVESSAKNSLQVTTSRVNTLATKGKAGQWLLDPGDLTVIDAPLSGGNDAAAFNGGPGAYTASNNPSTIADADVAAALTTGSVVLNTNGAGAGTGKITFDNGVVIDPTNAAAQSLTANAYGGIDFVGNAKIIASGMGALNVTLSAGNAHTLAGAISMSATSSINTNGGALLMEAKDAISIGDVNVGSLNVNTTGGGGITQTNKAVVSGNAVLAADTFAIALTNSGNNFNTLQLYGANLDVVDINGITVNSAVSTGTMSVGANGITIGGVTVASGTLNLTAGTGSISQSGGPLVAQGVTATAGGNISLNDASNDLTSAGVGSLTASGGAVTVKNIGALKLGNVSGTTSVDITAKGAITQNAATIINTPSGSFTADNGGIKQDITLTEANTFGTVAATGAAVKITDANALDLGAISAASLDVLAGGAVTQSGGAVVSGATTVGAGTAAVTLDSAANDFNSISVTGQNVTIRDLNALNLTAITNSATGSIDVQAGTTLTLNTALTASTGMTLASNGGALTTAGAVQGSGVLLKGSAGLTLADNITATGSGQQRRHDQPVGRRHHGGRRDCGRGWRHHAHPGRQRHLRRDHGDQRRGRRHHR